MINSHRLRLLESILSHYQLDSLLIYSTNEKYKYSNWLFRVRPLLYNYIFINKNGSYGFLEISYLVANLARVVGDVEIIEINETNPAPGIKKSIGQARIVGLIGDVPYHHIRSLINDDYKFVDLNDSVAGLLWQKTAEEIVTLREGAKILSSIISQVSTYIQNDTTEEEIERQLKISIFSTAEGLAFPVSITTDDDLLNSTVKFPTNKMIKKGSSVCIDMGLIYKGLYTDITRMFFTTESSIKDEYDILKQVHYDIISSLKPGIKLENIKQMYIEKLNALGLNGDSLEFQDLGHSIGFDVHEAPFLVTEKYKDFELQENMVFTLEPEILTKSQHRIRIEDMIVCRKDSCEVLTVV
jgi:Xaa-Pro aminopeptidase